MTLKAKKKAAPSWRHLGVTMPAEDYERFTKRAYRNGRSASGQARLDLLAAMAAEGKKAKRRGA